MEDRGPSSTLTLQSKFSLKKGIETLDTPWGLFDNTDRGLGISLVGERALPSGEARLLLFEHVRHRGLRKHFETVTSWATLLPVIELVLQAVPA